MFIFVHTEVQMPVLKSFLGWETRLQNFSLRRATPTAEAAAPTSLCG
ncbi:hypothetical protein [Nostoc sp. MG11]|nr:hypothetical protein [Nostoc sp. MG11]